MADPVIQHPTLLLDEQRCRANIARMAERVRAAGAAFRPHFKTHQSLAIGRWFKEAGVDRIAVSSVRMAEYFADEWDDITVAFPLNLRELDRIRALSQKITLNVTLDAPESLRALIESGTRAGVFIEIDTGYGRSGMPAHRVDEVRTLVQMIHNAPMLRCSGLLAHSGHAYGCIGRAAVDAVHGASKSALVELVQALQDLEPGITSMGDTPSCCLADDFTGIDEWRPGNFVFFDVMQSIIGSCDVQDIAVAVACPVVARYPDRREVIVYGGAVHFSRESVEHPEHGTIFGIGVERDGQHWAGPLPGVCMKRLSQEHGVLAVPDASAFAIGDVVCVLPVHSCLTAECLRAYRSGEAAIDHMQGAAIRR